MEVKINKEIRDYTENIYFGLSLRQFIFSVLACITTIVIYFTFKKYVGMEIVSWLCILGAIPFAMIGFLKYNGMTAEQFIVAFVKSEILIPRHLVFNASNFYYELLINKKKEGKNENI